MNNLELIEKLKEIMAFAEKYQKFFENPSLFIGEIKNMNPVFLKEQRDKYEDWSTYRNGTRLAPVNFVRFLILDKLINGKEVNIELIEEIERKIIFKDKNYFNAYSNHLVALDNLDLYLEEKKIKDKDNIFKTYSNAFRILFQIHYNFYNDKFILEFDEISRFIRDDCLKLKDKLNFSNVSFSGSNNLGSTSCWIAFYPKINEKHQNSYQLFIRISPKGDRYPESSIIYGLTSGSNVLEEVQDLKIQQVDNFNFDEFLQFYRVSLPKFWELNQDVKLKQKKGEIKKKTEISEEESVGEEVEEATIPLNQILYGPPGTGKTYKTIEMAVHIIEPEYKDKSRVECEKKYRELYDNGQIKFIAFHQSYTYEDFIEGLRYEKDSDKPLPKPGIFKDLIDAANKNEDLNYVLIIDEINRGKISKVFGELITCIEHDKRKGMVNEIEVELPYSKTKFKIPSNIYILGTMNSTDRSIALIDYALRRRFRFIKIYPDPEIIRDELIDKNLNEIFVGNLVKIFQVLNQRVEALLDKDHTIGHSFFLEINKEQDLYKVWYNQIIPLLEEYFYNDWEKLKFLLGEFKNIDYGRGFIKKAIISKEKLFETYYDDYDLYEIEEYEGKEDNFLKILKDTFL